MNQAFQVAMARLYTEPTVRHALYRGDASAFETGGLSSNELAALQKFACDNRDRLELYSGFLVKKKAMQPRKNLPVLSAALDAVMQGGWDSTWASYHEWLAERSEGAVREGDLALVAFVESVASTFGAGESVVREAARYERIKLQLLSLDTTADDSPTRAGCPWVARPFVIEAFDHDWPALVKGTRDGAGPVQRRAGFVLFWRHRSEKSVSTVSATKELGVLVGACDGRTTFAELTDIMHRAGVSRASEASVAAAVAELVKAGLLGMMEAERVP